MSFLVPALLAVLAAGVPRSGAPPQRTSAAIAPAAVAGRLVLRDGAAPVTLAQARRALGGRALALHLRNGWTVATARLEDDGFFLAEGEPGEWVIESVSAGDAVEFVDPPLVLAVRGGEVVCAGQVEVAFRDLGAELGHGTGRAAASEGCGDLAGKLARIASGRTVRTRAPSPAVLPVERSAWELAGAIRAGAAWALGGPDRPTESSVSATAVYGINRPVGDRGAVVIAASLAQTSVEGSRSRRTLAAGVGYGLFSIVEVMAGPELQLSGAEGSGAGVFGQLRLGSAPFGFGVRAARGKAGQVVTFGLDVAPLWLLGSLL